MNSPQDLQGQTTAGAKNVLLCLHMSHVRRARPVDADDHIPHLHPTFFCHTCASDPQHGQRSAEVPASCQPESPCLGFELPKL